MTDYVPSFIYISQLQVPPKPFSIMKGKIERDLKGKLNELFIEFDENSIAAASIGQVYKAKILRNGKVITPLFSMPISSPSLFYLLIHLLFDETMYLLQIYLDIYSGNTGSGKDYLSKQRTNNKDGCY